MQETISQIMVYGTLWCSDCRRVVRLLDQHQARYRYIDIEKDASAAAYVARVNKGNFSVPTIVFPDGSILIEPSNAVLQQKLTG